MATFFVPKVEKTFQGLLKSDKSIEQVMKQKKNDTKRKAEKGSKGRPLVPPKKVSKSLVSYFVGLGYVFEIHGFPFRITTILTTE